MATEYTITYTYKGQNNTSGNRSVAFNRFTASGDTDRKIGQITSIKYEHWHSSLGSMSWGLRGRLVFGDGSELISDQVYQHINNNVLKYVNTFETMPTAEQWATLTAIQTLDTAGGTGDSGFSSTLYWRANSTYPMKVIITFIEEPPVFYAPKVDTFQVSRVNEKSMPDDEGVYAATSLKLSLGDTEGLASAAVRIYYAADAYPIVGVSQYVDITARISDLLTGLYLNTDLIPGEWSTSSSWYFAVVFVAGEENAVSTSSIARAKGSLHVSGQRGGGICVCGYSKGTTENPLFESYAPAHFYERAQFHKGVIGINDYSLKEVDTGGTWIDGKRIYRKVIEVGAKTSNNMAIDVTALSIETYIDIRAMFYGVENYGNGYVFGGAFAKSDLDYVIQIEPTSRTNVGINATDRTWNSGFLILEYTKTTEVT